MNQIISPLTASDRCDRCGAQAVIQIKTKGQAESNLLFCGHHTMAYKNTLKTSAQIIWDVRGEVVHDKAPITL
jgi:hypothetical protein